MADDLPMPAGSGSTVSTVYGRFLQLDVLRGLAILLVILYHVGNSVPVKRCGPLRWSADEVARFGWTGVDLFFVLSGFLIGGLLFKEAKRSGAIDVRRFFTRRALKIWPPYFALLAFWLVRAHRHGNSVRQIWHTFWPNLLHLQNYVNRYGSHTWSLAVEEHFYVLLPLVLVLLLRRRPVTSDGIPGFVGVAVAMIGVAALWRCCFAGAKFDLYDDYFATHRRIDGLLFGVLLGYVYVFRPAAWASLSSRRIVLLCAGVALLIPMTIWDRDDQRLIFTAGYSFAYLGYGAILVVVMSVVPGQGWAGRLLASWPGRAVATIGFYSYSIYLWHIDAAIVPVEYWCKGFLNRLPDGVFFIVYAAMSVAAAIGVGVVMAFLIERPSLWARDRLTCPPPRPGRPRRPAGDPTHPPVAVPASEVTCA